MAAIAQRNRSGNRTIEYQAYAKGPVGAASSAAVSSPAPETRPRGRAADRNHGDRSRPEQLLAGSPELIADTIDLLRRLLDDAGENAIEDQELALAVNAAPLLVDARSRCSSACLNASGDA